MTNQIRKHIRPLPLVVSLAIIGALAAFVVLANNPGALMAHGGVSDHQASCDAMTDAEREQHNSEALLNGTDLCGPANQAPTHDAPDMETIVIVGVMDGDVNNTRTVAGVKGYFSDPDDDELTFDVDSSNPSAATGMLDDDGALVITAQGAGEATITVTATDADGSGLSVELDIMVEVRLSPAERYTIAPTMREYDAPAKERVTFTISAVDADNTPLDEDATVSLLITQYPGDSSTSPLVTRVVGLDSSLDNDITDDDILQGLLTVRATDPDGQRGFIIYFQCSEPGERVDIQMLDEEPQEVGSASITCKVPPEPEPDPDQITESECYSVTGYMGDNEDEAMDVMRDDAGPHTRPTHATNPEIGQDTIQILEDSASAQITVTSCEPGPVFIRFLDSDGDVFGTDVDECETCEGASGADVVGLDSQQKLEMNLGPTEMDAAKALMYDQYKVVVPGDGSDSYLVGKPGNYHQGTFRFLAPCDWEPFEIEVYEKNGKVLQELENGEFSQTVSCVPSPRPGPTGLVFEIDSQVPGEGRLRFVPARNAVSHTVLLIDAHNRNIITARDNASSPVEFDNLNSGWSYHIVVLAEGADDQYTAHAVKDYSVKWLDEADVPLSTAPSARPTRQHDLCKVEDAAITALLSDCDAAPVDLTAPASVTATADGSSVTVMWGAADNADRYIAVLFDSNFEYDASHVATHQTDGMVTFNNVSAGTYTAVVISIMDDANGDAEDIDFGFASVTVN